MWNPSQALIIAKSIQIPQLSTVYQEGYVLKTRASLARKGMVAYRRVPSSKPLGGMVAEVQRRSIA